MMWWAPVPDDVVAPGSFSGFFGFLVEDCWPEALVAAIGLRGGIAGIGIGDGAAPPALPISRPAASTQTPAAKRKCDRTTICPQSRKRYSPNFATFWHSPTIGCRALQVKSARTVRSNHSYDALMSNPQDQAALTMPALSGDARGEASR